MDTLNLACQYGAVIIIVGFTLWWVVKGVKWAFFYSVEKVRREIEVQVHSVSQVQGTLLLEMARGQMTMARQDLYQTCIGVQADARNFMENIEIETTTKLDSLSTKTRKTMDAVAKEAIMQTKNAALLIEESRKTLKQVSVSMEVKASAIAQTVSAAGSKVSKAADVATEFKSWLPDWSSIMEISLLVGGLGLICRQLYHRFVRKANGDKQESEEKEYNKWVVALDVAFSLLVVPAFCAKGIKAGMQVWSVTRVVLNMIRTLITGWRMVEAMGGAEDPVCGDGVKTFVANVDAAVVEMDQRVSSMTDQKEGISPKAKTKQQTSSSIFSFESADNLDYTTDDEESEECKLDTESSAVGQVEPLMDRMKESYAEKQARLMREKYPGNKSWKDIMKLWEGTSQAKGMAKKEEESFFKKITQRESLVTIVVIVLAVMFSAIGISRAVARKKIHKVAFVSGGIEGPKIAVEAARPSTPKPKPLSVIVEDETEAIAAPVVVVPVVPSMKDEAPEPQVAAPEVVVAPNESTVEGKAADERRKIERAKAQLAAKKAAPKQRRNWVHSEDLDKDATDYVIDDMDDYDDVRTDKAQDDSDDPDKLVQTAAGRKLLAATAVGKAYLMTFDQKEAMKAEQVVLLAEIEKSKADKAEKESLKKAIISAQEELNRQAQKDCAAVERQQKWQLVQRSKSKVPASSSASSSSSVTPATPKMDVEICFNYPCFSKKCARKHVECNTTSRQTCSVPQHKHVCRFPDCKNAKVACLLRHVPCRLGPTGKCVAFDHDHPGLEPAPKPKVLKHKNVLVPKEEKEALLNGPQMTLDAPKLTKAIGWAETKFRCTNCVRVFNGVEVPLHVFGDAPSKETEVTFSFWGEKNVEEYKYKMEDGGRISYDTLLFPPKKDMPSALTIGYVTAVEQVAMFTYSSKDAFLARKVSYTTGLVKSITTNCDGQDAIGIIRYTRCEIVNSTVDGNCGSPYLNSKGQVVGFHNAKTATANIFVAIDDAMVAKTNNKLGF